MKLAQRKISSPGITKTLGRIVAYLETQALWRRYNDEHLYRGDSFNVKAVAEALDQSFAAS